MMVEGMTATLARAARSSFELWLQLALRELPGHMLQFGLSVAKAAARKLRMGGRWAAPEPSQWNLSGYVVNLMALLVGMLAGIYFRLMYIEPLLQQFLLVSSQILPLVLFISAWSLDAVFMSYLLVMDVFVLILVLGLCIFKDSLRFVWVSGVFLVTYAALWMIYTCQAPRRTNLQAVWVRLQQWVDYGLHFIGDLIGNTMMHYVPRRFRYSNYFMSILFLPTIHPAFAAVIMLNMGCGMGVLLSYMGSDGLNHLGAVISHFCKANPKEMALSSCAVLAIAKTIGYRCWIDELQAGSWRAVISGFVAVHCVLVGAYLLVLGEEPDQLPVAFAIWAWVLVSCGVLYAAFQTTQWMPPPAGRR